MSTNNFSSSSPGFQARQQNSQYSPYVSPSLRQQGQRFNYAPSPYPRPRSSASKPNPALSGEPISYPIDEYGPSGQYYYRSEQSYNNSYGSSGSDKNGRFGSGYSSGDYGSPNSEYYSCNEDSFRSPMNSMSPHSNYQNSGYPGTKGQYSPFSSGFGGSPNKQPPNFQGSGYAGTPHQQQKRRGFGQRRFTQGRNGVPAAQKRGAPSGFYQGSGSGMDGNAFQNNPAKKPRVSVRCEICNIDFTSDIPYKMHLAGAKHMKKVKSKEVLETMETQGQVPQAKDNYYYCEHCQVMANSSQQLQMHLDGTKHKNKMRKLNESDKTEEETPKPDEVIEEDTGPKPAKMTKFYCDVCSLSLNSDIQLTQHIASKKHEAKVKGEPFPVKKKARKFTDAPANGNETTSDDAAPTVTTNNTEESENTTTTAVEEAPSPTAQQQQQQQKTYGVQELGSSFVPGGVLQ